MVFVSFVTNEALWVHTSGGVSGCNLACSAVISYSSFSLTFYILVQEAFRAPTNPSILACRPVEGRMISCSSSQSLLIKYSNSVYCAMAVMNAAYAWVALEVLFAMVYSDSLSWYCALLSLCWISSERDVWRAYSFSPLI